MKETWVVTGASGFLGYHMCRFLIDKGVEVRGIDIAPFKFEDLKGKVHFVQGDIREKELLYDIFEGASVIMHGAAALPRWSRKEIFDVNVNGTRAVLEVAREMNVPRVIFISSTAVYGIPKKHPIYEGDVLEGVGPYGESKILAELLCKRYRSRGIICSIIRPKTFIGPIRLGIFSVIFDWIASGASVPVIGSGNNLYQLLDVEDLVEAIWLVAHAPKEIANQEFNIGATEFGTVREHLEALIKEAGTGKRVISLPAKPVKFILAILDKLGLSPLYEWAYETVDKDHYVSVKKAMKLLGWRPKKTSIESLLESFRWYLEHYDEIKAKRGKTHTVQWDLGALAIAKAIFKLL